jgi:hypothetical protein
MSEVTPWFQAPYTVPTVPGPYEVQVGADSLNDPTACPAWQHWNGKFWGHRKNSPDAAEAMGIWPSNHQTPVWRGRTVPRICDCHPDQNLPKESRPVASSPALVAPYGSSTDVDDLFQ